MSRQAVKWSEVAGALVLCTGVALLSISRSTKPIGLSFARSRTGRGRGHRRHRVRAVQTGHRRRGTSGHPHRPWSRLVFGIQDALTRQTLEILQRHPWTYLFTVWEAYCLLATGIVGLWLMQNAFSSGPLHASLPTIAAGEPVAGIALGIVVFGDRIQISAGLLAIEAAESPR